MSNSSPNPIAIANALDASIGTEWRSGVFRGVMDCLGAIEDSGATLFDAGDAADDFGDDDDDVTCVDTLV